MAVNVYFTNAENEKLSRYDLLYWINDRIDAKYGKIEELSNGAAYCQLIDILFPGSLNLKKVKFQSQQQQHDSVQNFKLLQSVFLKLGVDKTIQIERLVNGKFQDNFEFIQWFKKFFDANFRDHEYNALEARGGIVLGSQHKDGDTGTNHSVSTEKNINSNNSTHAPRIIYRDKNQHNHPTPETNCTHGDTLKNLEKERDFYFDKLRKIELYCQDKESENHIFIKDILEILYAIEDGFMSPEELHGIGDSIREDRNNKISN